MAADGTCAQCIGTGRSYTFKNLYGTDVPVVQKTPVGGGISDYGRAFDGKSCIDNLANSNPHCKDYLNGTSCNTCDLGFILV